MEPLYAAVKQTLETHVSVCLETDILLRPSRKAMLACPAFAFGNGSAAAKRLEAFPEPRLFGASLLASVRAESGWLLFDLDKSVFDAYALTLPNTFLHGTDYVDRRMELLLRHGDMPLPACDAVLNAMLTASCACARRKWTAADTRVVLTMTHGLLGMERIRTEHALSRAAKIILYERRNFL